jgi:multicomponent Na+:H+ antiporter subunit C
MLMELPMALVIGLLFAAGTYMILRPNLIRLVMGFGLYSNATNLLLITIGGFTRETGAPFVGADPKTAQGLMDPLPPDIILTAIVISFAVGALMLIICYRVYLDAGTDNPQELPVDDDFTATGELRLVPAVGEPQDGHRHLAGGLAAHGSPLHAGAAGHTAAGEGRA